MISIVISTKDRSNKIVNCLISILDNNYQNFEVVVVDQSTDGQTRKVIKKINNPKIRYFKMREIGLSKGRNFRIKEVRGETIAFTDDDCVVDKNWLGGIEQSLKTNKNIVGVFGKVLPYKPELNKEKICPCTFLNDNKRIINKPCLHYQYIGFGNNMTFRKEVFEKLGGFKKWLGIGSLGDSAEDAEFALRSLTRGYKIMYNPKVIVYHNRLLTKKQFRKQCLSYSCGELACYGYFAFQGKNFAKKVIIDNFKDSYNKLKYSIKSILLFKKNSLKILKDTLEELFFRLRGLLVAFWYSKKEPLSR